MDKVYLEYNGECAGRLVSREFRPAQYRAGHDGGIARGMAVSESRSAVREGGASRHRVRTGSRFPTDGYPSCPSRDQ